MNSILKIVFLFIIITNCSFNSNSRFWTKETSVKDEIVIIKEKVLFAKEKIIQKELNPKLKIKLKFDQATNFRSVEGNNDGVVNFNGNLEKISKYKFSKIKNFDQFQSEIIFENNNLIFFDNKGSLIKFDGNSNLLWKKNYYLKDEKKLNPILFFAKKNTILIVADTISKYYAVNIETGDLLWTKYNNAAFISDIKIKGDKFFIMDSNNSLKCISLKDGSLVWEHKSDTTTIKSLKKISIALNNDLVIFNNSIGDVSALDVKNGNLKWIISTADKQNSIRPFLLKLSDIVIDNNSVIFSNNNDSFYSIDLETGFSNWKQKINSDLRPVIAGNLIITVSLEGYLFVVDRLSGNIIRITDIFDRFKVKNRKKIKPAGFMLGINNLFVTTNNGKLLIVDFVSGKTKSILKIDKGRISKPLFFKKKLYIIKNDSIIKLN